MRPIVPRPGRSAWLDGETTAPINEELPTLDLRILCCLAGLMLPMALGSAGVEAGMIVQTGTVALNFTDFHDGTSLVFDQYDSSHGPLTSVEITMDGTMRNLISGEYRGATVTITYTARGNLSLTSPNGHDLGLTLDLNTARTLNGAADDFGDEPVDTSDSADVTYTTAGDLAAFLGNSTFLLPFWASATQTFHVDGGNAFADIATEAGASVTLTYRFVPEPSSLALTCLGGLVFAWRLGRRRRAAA
jgi:hypothetical protein